MGNLFSNFYKTARKLPRWWFLSFFLIGCWPVMPRDGSGRVEIAPDEVVVGDWSTWTVNIAPGPGGISPGGGIRIKFPRAWFLPQEHLPGKHLQTDDPFAPAYVTARTDAPGVELSLSIVDTLSTGVAGRYDRVAEIRIGLSSVLRGRSVTVVFGDTKEGGRGFLAPPISGRFTVDVATDADGDGTYRTIASGPTVRIKPGKAVELALTTQSQAGTGLAVPLIVTAFDTTYGRYLREPPNPASGYRGEVRFFSSDPSAQLPPSYSYSAADSGVHHCQLNFGSPGIHRVWATGTGLMGVFVSNPVDVRVELPEFRTFWGDLHFHSEVSSDAIGASGLDYGRRTAGLDFCAITDHVDQLSPETWSAYLDMVNNADQSGRFVTLPAYSWTLGRRRGDHNVYFDQRNPPLIQPSEYDDPELVWSGLEGCRAVVIPIHPAITWGPLVGGQPWFDWRLVRPKLMPAVEIYSLNGASEFRTNPNGYSQVLPSEGRTEARGPYYVRQAWSTGSRLAVVAGSGDHTSRPGRPEGGLTAVMAPQLSRSGVFEGLKSGFTYATTGARILLDFRVSGHRMGERFESGDAPVIEADVHGTGPIRELQIMKYDFKRRRWSVPVGLRPDRMDVTIRYVDSDFSGDSLYYLRLRQTERYRHRWVMAWSSPIWVDRSD
ncbi:hypothetical protein ACFLT7_02515 [candidate division KSB1 bacterium]